MEAARSLVHKFQGLFQDKQRVSGHPLPQFVGVPNPKGDFVPCAKLVPHQQITLTPYGYLATGNQAQFLVHGVHFSESTDAFKVMLQFTSFDCALSPKLCFDLGKGFSEEETVPLPILASGRIDTCVTIPQSVKQVRLDPIDQECIFSIHKFDLTPCTAKDLAILDLPDLERKADIVCFPVIDWHYRFQRPQQLLSRLAEQGHRVFYVATRFTGLHVCQVTAQPVSEQITEIALPGNPRLNLYKDQVSENTLNKGLDALTEYLHQQQCDEVVLLINLPFWLPYAQELKRKFGWKLVYDCMDDHSGFSNNTETMLAAEQDSIRVSDLLVTTSDLLFKKHHQTHPNCHLISNAGDYKHFRAEVPNRKRFLQELKRPIIGYYGALAEWFDIEAFQLAAEKHPDWSFVLIGHVNEEAIEELGKNKNVHLLGEKSYEELPRYLASFDVCTIPFLRNPLTEATNPVKVFEYLAAGKPVVARALPEVKPLADVLYLYEGPEDFVKGLEQALDDTEPEKVEHRRVVASMNTWEKRVEVLSAEMNKLYGKASIIIVSYQCLDYLRKCISSILANTQYPSYDIVIVDNASSQPVVNYLSELEKLCPNIRVILNKDNRGFAAANNQGIRAASDAEYYVLLNNDTVVPPGWLSRLLFHAHQEEIGLVGPVSNSVGNEAQIPVCYDTSNLKDLAPFARAYTHAYQSEVFDIRVLAMFCVAFRREILDKVGFLDEEFGIGMFEDDDYAQRIRQAGYRVICAEDVFVHHFGSASFSKLPSERYRQLFEKNRLIYEKKWGKWIPHQYR